MRGTDYLRSLLSGAYRAYRLLIVRNDLQTGGGGKIDRYIGIGDYGGIGGFSIDEIANKANLGVGLIVGWRGVSFRGVTVGGVDNSFNKDVYISKGGGTGRGVGVILIRERGVVLACFRWGFDVFWGGFLRELQDREEVLGGRNFDDVGSFDSEESDDKVDLTVDDVVVE